MIPNLTHKILYLGTIFGTVATIALAQLQIAVSISPYDIVAIAFFNKILSYFLSYNQK